MIDGVHFRNADDVAVRMRRIVCGGGFYKEFRTMEHENVSEKFLHFFGCARENGRFYDGGFPLADEREYRAYHRIVEPLRGRGRRYGDEHDVARCDLLFVHRIGLFKRVTDHLVAARLKIVCVILSDPPLADTSDFHFSIDTQRNTRPRGYRYHPSASFDLICLRSSMEMFLLSARNLREAS